MGMRRASTLLVIALSSLSSLAGGLLGAVYPIFVLDQFSATLVDVGLLCSVFGLVAAVFKMPAGRLVDLYGTKRVFLIGAAIGAVCPILYTLAPSLSQLYAIEFLSGISYALQRPALLALTVDASDHFGRGLLIGVFESASDLANAIAALISTVIASIFGFKLLFLTCSCLEAVAGILAMRQKELDRGNRSQGDGLKGRNASKKRFYTVRRPSSKKTNTKRLAWRLAVKYETGGGEYVPWS
jgi:MFS family permease